MRRGRFDHILRKKSGIFALNITSMTDMFTIMLVFLLQSYADTTVTIDRIEEVNLASSRSDLTLNDAPKVLRSKSGLYLNNKSLNLEEDTTDKNLLISLFKELKDLSAKDEKKAAKGELLLIADKDLTYAQTRKVLYTASLAGYPKVQMVTILGGGQ